MIFNVWRLSIAKFCDKMFSGNSGGFGFPWHSYYC